MQINSKNISIQIWTDLYYCRTIALWYPPKPQIDDTLESIETIFNDAPFIIVLSSMFKPRSEVLGFSPVAPGQHPIPKDFLEEQVRTISHMFANELGTFQPESKAAAKTFIAKQTISYTLIKELNMDVRPATGTMSLEELKNSIEQFSKEEQKYIKVITNGENPLDTAKKQLDNFLYTDKNANIKQYITVTKMMDIYGTKDPYINNSQLPEDPADSIAPGTEDAEMNKEILSKTEEAKTEDKINQDTLKTFDEMKEDQQQDIEQIDVEQNETTEPDRVAVLEKLLKEKEEEITKLKTK